MEIYKVLVLAIIQGVTELLPISSSAHLILASQILDMEMNTFFLSTLHLGTTLAILVHFSNILFKNISKKKTQLLYVKIFVSTLPAITFGYFFQQTIENSLRGNFLIAMSLIFWGIVMIIVERKSIVKEIDLHNITWIQSLTMGVSQTISLIPGTSRSGITTLAGIFTGLNKYTALQYSFLLGIPVLMGVSIYEMTKYPISESLSRTNLVGIFVSGVFAYLSLLLLRKISKEKWLTVFGCYRILLGAIVLVAMFLQF